MSNPFLYIKPYKPKSQIFDDTERAFAVLGSSINFELDYEWDPSLDPDITPVIFEEWDKLNQKLGSFTRNATKVLSVGGGGSTPTYEYLSEDAQVLCVLNPSLHDLIKYSTKALEDFKVYLVRGVGESMPFASDFFDLVEIPATLDHCADPRRVLKEAYRVLSCGGRIVITGGNSQSWYRKAISVLRIPYQDKHHDHHSIHLNPKLIRTLMESEGFSHEGVETLYFLKLPKSVERRVKRRPFLKLYGYISDALLPKVLGKQNGGMFIVWGKKP